MEIILGLTAAVCWGTSDFCARFASRRIGAYRTLMLMQISLLWYALTWLMARSQPRAMRALMALALEAAFEVIENSDFAIRRYRANTMSLDYYGDSVMNSMCDILMCMAGFAIAAVAPTRFAMIAVIALELVLALWIRDDLALNIVMLIRPVGAILKWQMAK